MCSVTGSARVRLSLEQYELWCEFQDYWATDQLLTTDPARRELMIRLKAKAHEYLRGLKQERTDG